MAVLVLQSGCGSCGEQASVSLDEPSQPQILGRLWQITAVRTTSSAEPKTLSNEGPGSGNLVALLYEDKGVVLWGEGHQSAEVPKSDVRFSPVGFEWTVPGGTRYWEQGARVIIDLGRQTRKANLSRRFLPTLPLSQAVLKSSRRRNRRADFRRLFSFKSRTHLAPRS